MKKFLIIFILFIIVTGITFAQQPEKEFGIGAVAGWHGGWPGVTGWGYMSFALKIPHIPIYWALNTSFNFSYFHLGVSGDYYFFERPIVSSINLNWFIGAGAWVNIGFGDASGFELGGRLPVGVRWHILDFLELFSDIAPSLGLRLMPDFYFPAGGWPIEIGVRFWF
jgi:hypothetical protein